MNLLHAAALTAVVAVCTLLTRVIPFLFFGGKKETPEAVRYLGRVLPPAIIATLVVYCLRNIDFRLMQTGGMFGVNSGPAELAGVLVTAGLQLWKRQILLSIAGGTACYMALVQLALG